MFYCSDCRFCSVDGECVLKEKKVNPNAQACGDFQER